VALHLQALADVAAAARGTGYGVLGACASPITGTTGNREFFLHLVPDAPGLPEDELASVLRKAVEP
jgi:23S rRNA (cytidine1920-2'-O)/16S rRNA (cytidine1409-2'-O)-methyltransferase